MEKRRFFRKDYQVWEDGAGNDGGDLLLCEAETYAISVMIASKLNAYDRMVDALETLAKEVRIALAEAGV